MFPGHLSVVLATPFWPSVHLSGPDISGHALVVVGDLLYWLHQSTEKNRYTSTMIRDIPILPTPVLPMICPISPTPISPTAIWPTPETFTIPISPTHSIWMNNKNQMLF